MKYCATIIIVSSMFMMTSSASAMTVSEFLPKAEKLMNSGVGAMFSKHRKSVSSEMKKVATGYRADIKTAQKAGRKTASCPPKKASVNGKEFLAYLQRLPVAKRGIEVRTAFDGFMAQKYPC